MRTHADTPQKLVVLPSPYTHHRGSSFLIVNGVTLLPPHPCSLILEVKCVAHPPLPTSVVSVWTITPHQHRDHRSMQHAKQSLRTNITTTRACHTSEPTSLNHKSTQHAEQPQPLNKTHANMSQHVTLTTTPYTHASSTLPTPHVYFPPITGLLSPSAANMPFFLFRANRQRQSQTETRRTV